MRIGQVASQLTMQQTHRQNQRGQQKQLEQSKLVEPQTIIEQVKNAKQIVKESAQVGAEIQEAQNEMGEDDPKVQQLMEKFKSGSKLTAEEMSYIRKNAPGQMEYIDRIMREREMMELSLRMAPSKMDVQITTLRIAKNIEKHQDVEERKVLMNHLRDVKMTYEKTEEYKEKPNTPLDRNEVRIRTKFKMKPKTETVKQAYDYLEGKKKDQQKLEQSGKEQEQKVKK